MSMPALSPLEQRLRESARRVAAGDLAGEWFHGLVSLRAPRAGRLAADPLAPGRVRGAWGNALKAVASAEAIAGDACPWQPPCTLDVFFRRQGFVTPGLEIPKPYTIRLAADGPDLVVELRLFGFATDWLEAAGEAMVRALRDGVQGPDRRGLAVTDRQAEVFEAVALPEPAAMLGLRFETPLALRREHPDAPLLPGLIASLCNRISGLARWQDAEIEDGSAWARAMMEAAAGVETLERLTPVAAGRRSSSRQGRRDIPVAGLTGDLILAGNLTPLLPLLAIGQTTHAGSHTAIGQGAYTFLLDV